MSELGTLELAGIALAFVVGGVVKGMIGIGLPIVVISILSQVYPVPAVLALVSVPILATNLWQAVRAGGLMAPLRRFWPVILCLLLFVWLTAQLVVELDPRILYGILGLAFVIFTVSHFVKAPRALPPSAERWAGPLAGTIGGIMGGLSTIWGPPITIYFLMLRLPKEEFVRTVGLVWFAGSVPLVGAYVANGLLDGPAALRSLLACAPAFLGLAVGQWLRARIDQERFRKLLLFALFLIGLNLIRRAVF